MIVNVQYKNKKTDEFGGRKYSYFCDLPVDVGDIVKAPVANGSASVARVAEINIPQSAISEDVLPLLREITEYGEERDTQMQLEELTPVQTGYQPQPEPFIIDEELIVVRQLPVIEENLLAIKSGIQSRVDEALSMICTDYTVKYIKEMRTMLRKEYDRLEASRKDVKAAILAPYDRFEKVYKECVGDIYRDADRQLKEKIDSVEDGLRDSKKFRVERYFNEMRSALGLPDDLVSFDKSPIRVTLSASEKTLYTQVKTFLTLVSDDYMLIQTHEYADEIMPEFRATLNGRQAILNVKLRHERIEEERKRREEQAERERAQKERSEAAVMAVESVIAEEKAKAASQVTPPPQPLTTAPAVEPIGATAETEKVYVVKFSVQGTKTQLCALKNFLKEGNYNYGTV